MNPYEPVVRKEHEPIIARQRVVVLTFLKQRLMSSSSSSSTSSYDVQLGEPVIDNDGCWDVYNLTHCDTMPSTLQTFEDFFFCGNHFPRSWIECERQDKSLVVVRVNHGWYLIAHTSLSTTTINVAARGCALVFALIMFATALKYWK